MKDALACIAYMVAYMVGQGSAGRGCSAASALAGCGDRRLTPELRVLGQPLERRVRIGAALRLCVRICAPIGARILTHPTQPTSARLALEYILYGLPFERCSLSFPILCNVHCVLAILPLGSFYSTPA